MSVQAEITAFVGQLGAGKVFGYQDLPAYESAPNAVAVAISRLVKANKIKRLAKGQFYRPKQGVLGEVRPSDSEVIRSLLFKGNVRVGYITGPSLYNRLGLTTQIPKTVTIAINGARQLKQLNALNIRLKSVSAPISEEQVTLLEWLDVAKDIKNISDTRPDEVLDWLLLKAKSISNQRLNQLIELALDYYPASVKAVLGLVLDSLGKEKSAVRLKTALNPLTKYKLGLNSPLAKKWNIN